MGRRITMNQVIHAAVRRDLGRLEAALGRADTGDLVRARRLEVAYANLHRELQHHHQSEDALVFPFVAKVAPAPELLTAMEDEHHAMAEALAETRAAMAAYASTASAADATQARDSVTRTTAIVDAHLTHEENDFEPLLWPHEDTAEWKAVEKQLRRAGTGNFFAWLQDGMSDENRRFLRSTIPAPVTFLLSQLGGRAYHRDVAPVWKDSNSAQLLSPSR